MVWIDRMFAGVVIAVCLALFVRLCLTPRLRHRLDGAALRSFFATRRILRQAVGWRARRRQATRAAEEAIERARRGSWDGNVYSAKSFKDKPRKPH
jgi:hypothetical protein